MIEKIAQSLKHSLNKLDSGKRTVVAVYLFGSRIKGAAKKDSDLDIAFLLDARAYRNDPLATVAPAYLAATNLGMHLAMETDVNILNAASLEIAYEVITTGKCLLEYDADKRMEYEIALRGMYFDFKPFLDEIRANCVNGL